MEEFERNQKSMEIFQYMNVYANPCENFYEYTCGNWRTFHPATPMEHSTSAMGNALAVFRPQTENLLSEFSTHDNESERKVKLFYQSCMKLPSLTQIQFQRRMKSITRDIGEMPALHGQKWKSFNFNWIATASKTWNKYGVNKLFDIDISTSGLDTSSNRLVIKPPIFELRDPSVQGIKTYQTEIENNLIKFLGSKRSYAKRLASDIAKFEASLVKLSQNSDDTVMIVPNIESVTVTDFYIPEILNISLGYKPDKSLEISKPQYFQSLPNLIKKTPKATVGNFIYYHLLMSLQNKESCFSQVMNLFPAVFSKMIYRFYQLQGAVNEYQQIYEELLVSTADALEDVSWLDDETREFYMEKLHALKLVVQTFDTYDLDEMYKNLNLQAEDDYFQNIRAIKRFSTQKLIDSLNMKPVPFLDSVLFTTPAHSANFNAILIPISMFLAKYFQMSGLPKALHYSRNGFMLGHEIMHGFMGDSRFYNYRGVKVAMSETNTDHEERMKCIFDEYTNFPLLKTLRPQHPLQAENSADFAGLALAYDAYTRWLTNESRTKTDLIKESLPYLALNAKQLFFVYYSQNFCTDYDMEFEMSTLDDVHSMGQYRSVLPLRNFNEFAKAFNCPVGSVMNPEEKCSLL